MGIQKQDIFALRKAAMGRILSQRILVPAGAGKYADEPMIVEALIRMPDGETKTCSVSIAPRTPAGDIGCAVRSALSLEPTLAKASIEKITIRARRKR